jgi:hypothetical protein
MVHSYPHHRISETAAEYLIQNRHEKNVQSGKNHYLESRKQVTFNIKPEA